MKTRLEMKLRSGPFPLHSNGGRLSPCPQLWDHPCLDPLKTLLIPKDPRSKAYPRSKACPSSQALHPFSSFPCHSLPTSRPWLLPLSAGEILPRATPSLGSPSHLLCHASLPLTRQPSEPAPVGPPQHRGGKEAVNMAQAPCRARLSGFPLLLAAWQVPIQTDPRPWALLAVPLTLEGQAWALAHILEEVDEGWPEDLRAAMIGSHDVQQSPAPLAAVPVRTHA